MKQFFVLSVLSIFFSGCATIVKPDRQSVQITGGLENGETQLRLPDGNHTLKNGSGTILISRSRSDIPIEVTCNGSTKSGVVPTKYDVVLSGGGNLIFGGVIGWIVDAMGDKAFDVKSPYNVSQLCEQRNVAAEAKKP